MTGRDHLTDIAALAASRHVTACSGIPITQRVQTSGRESPDPPRASAGAARAMAILGRGYAAGGLARRYALALWVQYGHASPLSPLDLALALFIGTAAGTYSSIFVATPFLCQMKEHEPAMKALAARVAARKAGQERKASEKAAKVVAGGPSGSISDDVASDDGSDEAAAAGVAGAAAVATETRKERPHRQGPRNQPKKQSRSKRGKS